MKGLEMVSNIKFIRMKEGKKSSLIFISQEERAVGTRASFFFLCKHCKFAPHPSAKGFNSHIAERSLLELWQAASRVPPYFHHPVGSHGVLLPLQNRIPEHAGTKLCVGILKAGWE